MRVFFSPRHIVRDNTGLPVSGAQLHFYKAGTLEYENTYADTELTIPHTNPVIADSAGLFPAIFFSDTDYKAVLNDASGFLIWEQDNLAHRKVKGEDVQENAIGFDKIAHTASRGLFVFGDGGVPGSLPNGETDTVLASEGENEALVFKKVKYPPGYKTGFELSVGADPEHDISVAAGHAIDSTNTANIIGAAMTKQIDTAWAAGSDQGGMATGTAQPDTTYHVIAIVKDDDGTVDYYYDTDPAAVNKPAGYGKFLVLGSFNTDASSNILGVLSDDFESEELEITSGGPLTLPHELGVEPKDIHLHLVCKVSEHGYTAGQKKKVGFWRNSSTVGVGANITYDATNIFIRYGNFATVFYESHADTGAPISFTNANWRLVVRAKK